MSSEFRALFSHVRIYAVASLVGRAAAFFVIPIYTHSLDADEYGVLGVVGVASEILGAAIGLRLGAGMSRIYFAYDDPDERNEVVSSAILAMLGIAAAGAILLPLLAPWIGALLIGTEDAGIYMALGIAGLLLNMLYTLGLNYLQIRQQSGMFAIVSSLRAIVYLATAVVLVGVLKLGVIGALAGIVVVNAVAFIGVVLPLLFKLGVRFSPKKFRAIMAFSVPLVPAELAEVAMLFAERTLLAKLGSMTIAGFFFLGSRFGDLLYAGLIAPFTQIYLIRRLESHSSGLPDVEASRAFTYFFVVVVWGGLALALLAPEILWIVATRAYEPALAAVPALVLSQVLLTLVLILELGIYYERKPMRLTASTLFALVVHIPLNLLLIPLFGIVGASMARCLSSCARIGLLARLARGLGGPVPEWRKLVGILILGIALTAFGTAWDLDSWAVDFALRIVVIVSFPFCVFMSPVFEASDRARLRGFLRGTLAPTKVEESGIE